jgi:hypothetical protein
MAVLRDGEATVRRQRFSTAPRRCGGVVEKRACAERPQSGADRQDQHEDQE